MSENTSRAERLTKLTQTTRGTPMGTLLRSFWHPIAISEKLKPGAKRPVRILNEDLTLYRGESGRAYLVGGRCAHRLTVLHTGWVQGDEIRCMYHGWKYDGMGRCTEGPAEKASPPTAVKIAGYPVHEYCGLIFAYLGDGPAPAFDLPRRDSLERPDRILYQSQQMWPCNWFQKVENALDPVHVSFVHHKGHVGPFGASVTQAVPELKYTETDAGIRQIAKRSASNVRISNWSFPNNNHVAIPSVFKEDPWIDLNIWMVPVDDGHTARFQLYCLPFMDERRNGRILDHLRQHSGYNPPDHHDELFYEEKYPTEEIVELTTAQDYVVQMGQGTIADRLNERLGQSDEGIVLLRKIFWREMEAIEKGLPTKQWRRLQNVDPLSDQVAQAVAG